MENFDEAQIVPHPYEIGKTITLKELKQIQDSLRQKQDLRYTILSGDVKYVAGVDIGHHKTDETKANVVISIYEYPNMKEVYRTNEYVELTFPYIAGFLGFREVEHFKLLFDKVNRIVPQFYPDVIMVDGNGLLHYHSFGSACHLGVVLNIPTIGIGKTLYCIDDLNPNTYKLKKNKGEYMNLIGTSGKVWGRAVWNSKNASNCIFVSQGNHINLDEATKIVINTSIHRIPEPVRQADLMSKHFVK